MSKRQRERDTDKERERKGGYTDGRKAKISLEFTNFLSGRERQIRCSSGANGRENHCSFFP
jgi:hypothetical protein